MIRVSVTFAADEAAESGAAGDPGGRSEPPNGAGRDGGAVNANLLERAARAALEHGGVEDFELSVAVVSDAALAELHDRYLGDPSETDVMSFDLSDDLNGPAGEVVVSLDRARQVARGRGLPVEREVALYTVHGTLHLVGFDDLDAASRERMREAENAVLGALGFEPESGAHELADGELERDPTAGEPDR